MDASYPDDETPPADAMGRILDAREGVLHDPREFHSITAHNPYFEAYDAAEGELEELLEDVTVEVDSTEE